MQHWSIPLKKKTTIVKFNNSKDCLQIVRAKKKRLKDLDGNTFIYQAMLKSSLTMVYVAFAGGQEASVNA